MTRETGAWWRQSEQSCHNEVVHPGDESMMTSMQVVEAFAAAVNSGEISRLVCLMTPDHMFIVGS